MSYIKDFQNIGLKRQEADIYLACLRLGIAKVSDLTKEVDIPRTSIYIYIENLIEKGFIKKSKKGNIEYFLPVEPSNIFQNIKEKTDSFSNIIPQLTKIMDLAGKKPKIEFYDNKQGLLKICEKAIKFDPKHIIYAIETGVAVKSYFEKVDPETEIDWQKKFLKQGSVIQEVMTEDLIPVIKSMSEEKKKILRMKKLNLRTVSEKDFPFSINLLLTYPDNIFIMAPQDNFTLFIENKNVYNSLLTMYKLLYEKSEAIDIKNILSDK